MVPTAFSSGAEAGLHAGSGGRAQPCSAESMSRFLDRLRENNRGAFLKSTHVPLVLDRDVPYGFVSPIDCKMYWL